MQALADAGLIPARALSETDALDAFRAAVHTLQPAVFPHAVLAVVLSSASDAPDVFFRLLRATLPEQAAQRTPEIARNVLGKVSHAFPLPPPGLACSPSSSARTVWPACSACSHCGAQLLPGPTR